MVQSKLMRDYYWVTDRLISSLGHPDELHRSSPLNNCESALEVLLATILTQNTNDRNANRAWENFKARFPDPEMALKVSADELADVIRVAGLAGQKAVTIQKVLNKVAERFGSWSLEELSDPEEAWEFLNRLPGVGPKTTACTMVFGLKFPSFPVDTHIHRVALRLGWVPSGHDPVKAQHQLTREVPTELHHNLHILFLNLGRIYCHPRHPDCHGCPLAEICAGVID